VSVIPEPTFAYAQAPAKGAADAVSLADVAEQALPSVVNVSSTRVVQTKRSPFFSDPFFRRFFGNPDVPPEREARSLGSGVIISEDGTVLTNSHVVDKAEDIRVTTADRREYKAKIVGSDPKSDVAVITLQGKIKGLKPIRIGDSDRMRLGNVVLAIGNPFGVGQTVTMGIVSATGRANVGIAAYEDFIQTDAAINPGNSGGALVNMAGELVGINTAILSRTGGYQGIGFAIPTNMAVPIKTSLLKHGEVRRGFLGVTIQDLTPELAKAMGLKRTKGVLVADVTEGSPADEAGMKRGDIIIAIDDRKVNSTGRLRNLVASHRPGEKVEVKFLRGEDAKSTTVKLAKLPASMETAAERREPEEGQMGGLSLRSLTPQLRERLNVPPQVRQGVVVVDIARGSAAARTGLEQGDVILEVNRKAVGSPSQFAQRYRAVGSRVLLLVYRKGSTIFLVMPKK
jgi:serine protease Do